MPWQRRRSEPQKRADDDGPVDWSALRGSPAKAMQDTLAWVRQEYGAVDAFLEGAGADEALLQFAARLEEEAFPALSS